MLLDLLQERESEDLKQESRDMSMDERNERLVKLKTKRDELDFSIKCKNFMICLFDFRIFRFQNVFATENKQTMMYSYLAYTACLLCLKCQEICKKCHKGRNMSEKNYPFYIKETSGSFVLCVINLIFISFSVHFICDLHIFNVND